MTKARDLVGVVEAAYRIADSDEDWLRDLTSEVKPLLDVGLGIAAFYFDAREGQELEFSTPIVLGAPADAAASLALAAALRLLPSTMVRQAFGARTWMATASQAFGLGEQLRDFFLARQFGHRFGYYDMLGFKVDEPTGKGLIMLSALPDIRSVSTREAATWGMCAAHVGAGLRLRRLFRDGGFAGSDAVLSPDGSCVHAEAPAQAPEARDALRRAVLASERARGSMRRTDPVEALELWQALVAGRWSLVEHFDTDGHRYLVAKRNDPSVRDPRGLSLRERQVVAYAALGHPNKLIGYDLGLAPATVSKHLTSAMKKLGVRTHAELMTTVSVTNGRSRVGPGAPAR